MTTARTDASPPSALTARRLGPVITTVAAVVGAVIMFGIGVLLGRIGASLVGAHHGARTGMMLGGGVLLGLTSAISSARRHLPRR